MFFLNVKAMIVVLVTAFIMFALLKPMFLRFIDEEDFKRRRVLWFVLAATAFLTPSIWLYLLIAIPSLLWAARRDSNPIAIWFFVILAVPNSRVAIPLPLVTTFFDISHERMLGIFLLFPLAVRHLRDSSATSTSTMKTMDFFLLTYIVYQIALALPYDSATGILRQCFTTMLDTFLVYFAFSRAITRRFQLVDVMASLCLSALVLAPLAAFESMRNWLLYTGIGESWGQLNEYAWLFRGASLRAQLTTGHSIALGYVMATALAFWLYLKTEAKGARLSWTAVPLLCMALIVSYSRGAWVLAAMLPILMVVLAPSRSGAEFKTLVGAAVVAACIYISPFGDRVVNVLPFIGTGSQDTVEYRQQLADVSWQLVQQHPFFGNPFAGKQMESLRQGQGLIDMVNQYAGIAVFQGLVGLSLFAGFNLAAVLGAYVRMRRASADDGDLASAGKMLIACMVATLVFLATVPGAWFTWALAGLLAAYTSLGRVSQTVPIDQTFGRQFASKWYPSTDIRR